MDEAAQQLHVLAIQARADNDDLLLDRLGREMIALGESSGDAETVAWGNYHRGIALNNLNHGAEAERVTRVALKMFDALGDRFASARAMMNLAVIELDIHTNAPEARRLFENSIAIIRESGEPLRLGIALGNLSEILRLEGNYRGAIASAKEALAIYLQLGESARAGIQWSTIAHCQALLRDYPASIESMRESYALLRQYPNPRWVALYFDIWVFIAAKLGRLEVAAQLSAFVDLFRFDRNVRRLQGMLPWLSATKERIERDLTEIQLEELTAAGEAMTVEQAQELAETIQE